LLFGKIKDRLKHEGLTRGKAKEARYNELYEQIVALQ
jgi:hypothetical protein